jgi:dihydrodipicolinate synthase/N-acetylneuraminate lyase
LKRPAILHWLGEAFDPELKGYWGTNDTSENMEAVLALIADNRDKVDGIKISLLDAQQEIEMRRRLPSGIRMYTGDDFHYPELIRGDGSRFSHALLGILDAIAPAASRALLALDAGDLKAYDELMSSTLPLSRHIFQAPTYHYKAGLVFLAWLNGHQSHFQMLGGLERSRSVEHLSELFVLADRARLLSDPELAVARMESFLAPYFVSGGAAR